MLIDAQRLDGAIGAGTLASASMLVNRCPVWMPLGVRLGERIGVRLEENTQSPQKNGIEAGVSVRMHRALELGPVRSADGCPPGRAGSESNRRQFGQCKR